jgi:hypothetical protein
MDIYVCALKCKLCLLNIIVCFIVLRGSDQLLLVYSDMSGVTVGVK